MQGRCDMQSGILDKNGKMICYGDRVRFDTSRDGSRPSVEGYAEPINENANGFRCRCVWKDASGVFHAGWMYFIEEDDNICEDVSVVA